LTITSAPARSASVEPGLERRREPAVVRMGHHVVDAQLASDLGGAIGRTVVDDQPLDDVDARHLSWQGGQRGRQRRLLVEARDLDHQLHSRLSI
jgi:hypothetical protein